MPSAEDRMSLFQLVRRTMWLDQGARLRAVRAIGERGEPRVAAALCVFLPFDTEVVVAARLEALRRIGPTAAPYLVPVLERSRAEAEMAAEALRGYGPAAVPALGAALASISARAQFRVVELLVECGDPCALTALCQCLETAQDRVKLRIIEFLESWGGPEAVAALSVAIQEESIVVRGAAALALGTLGDSSALQVLRDWSLDAAEPVRLRNAIARTELGETGPDLHGPLANLHWERDLNVALRAVRAIGRLAVSAPHPGLRRVVPALVALLQPWINLSGEERAWVRDVRAALLRATEASHYLPRPAPGPAPDPAQLPRASGPPEP